MNHKDTSEAYRAVLYNVVFFTIRLSPWTLNWLIMGAVTRIN